MTKRTFNFDLAASALVAAAFHGDAHACQRFGLSKRTLSRYRVRLQSCPQLAAIFERRKEVYLRGWADEIPIALRAAISFVTEATSKAASDPSALRNPQMLFAITNALKTLADIQFTTQLINARLAGADREAADLGDTPSVSTAYRN